MEDKSQEEKQNFLRENILEKGYDVNQFVAFLQSKKGEAGSDISNWSKDDLHIVVKEFISNNTINSENQPQQNQNLSQEQQSNVPTITNQNQNAGANQSPRPLNDQDYQHY